VKRTRITPATPVPETTPTLRAVHPAAARWIGALIRMTAPHPAMTAILDIVEHLQERPYRTNFVLLGEPGTGKEGLARALHHLTCPEGPLVRVHFIIGRSEGPTPNPDRGTLERAVEAIVRTWIDALGDELARAHDPVRARALLERYRDAFSEGYREVYPPATALADIRVI